MPFFASGLYSALNLVARVGIYIVGTVEIKYVLRTCVCQWIRSANESKLFSFMLAKRITSVLQWA